MTDTILTKRGVCKQLAYSPYNYTYLYNGKVVTLNFSSKLHLENFTKNRHKNHAMIYNYIYKRFKFKLDVTFLSDFNLYRKIEKRGCYINYDGKIYTSIEQLSLT